MVSYVRKYTSLVKDSKGLNPCCNGRWSRTIVADFESKVVYGVLILVVMEDGLVQMGLTVFTTGMKVLILVVMEDGLVLSSMKTLLTLVTMCLNPCCNGRWSRTSSWIAIREPYPPSLNPYCSGQWSRTLVLSHLKVIVNISLNPYCSGQWSRTYCSRLWQQGSIRVLILIVVDNGLVLRWQPRVWRSSWRLNPYCSGQWFRTTRAEGLTPDNRMS